MFSPHLHTSLIQTHIEDLHRQASSRHHAATRDSAIRHDAVPPSAYFKRVIERLGGRAAPGATASL